jgi:uncharacterized protein involved in exopolysaccharide biosynthesis
MAITAITPRDRLQVLVDLGRKTLRYWWLIGLFAVVGGALALAFAQKRPKRFQSWATIFYQERIQSSLLTPNREEMVQRNIGDKYRELLLARAQLAQIIEDPKLNPFPKLDPDLAIDDLRTQIKLEGRGGNAFRIVYTDADPDRAKAVTEKLTKMLQEKDEELRNNQARETVEFATKQKESAELELKKRRSALAQFLSDHPEFAVDPNSAQSEGAGIRARQSSQAQNQAQKPLTPEAQKILEYERQRQRITLRLNASPDAPPVRIASPPSPERTAALAALAEAERELGAARREAEGAEAKYGPKHPTVLNAQKRLETAQEAHRRAKAGVPPEEEFSIAPASPQDRSKLQRQLDEIDKQIAKLRNAKPGAPPDSQDGQTETSSWIVQLETDHADLRRAVAEQNERVSSLAQSVFRSELDARQKLAEAGGRLSLIDPPFKPVKPSGPGKKIFLMAGVMLFLVIGLVLSVLLAVIDDRLYRQADLTSLGIAVLGVIPPAPKLAKAKARKTKPRAGKALPPPVEKDAA